jgi:Restriction endonuclease
MLDTPGQCLDYIAARLVGWLPLESRVYGLRDAVIEAGLDASSIAGESLESLRAVLGFAAAEGYEHLCELVEAIGVQVLRQEGACPEAAAKPMPFDGAEDWRLAICRAGIGLRAYEKERGRTSALETGSMGIECGNRASREDLLRWRRRISWIDALENRQQAGNEFTRLLFNAMFCEALRPKLSVRNPGEELDITFRLDGRSFVVECKNTSAPTAPGELNSFIGKMSDKPARGVFWSLGGYTEQAVSRVQRAPNRFLLFERRALNAVLDGRIGLRDLLVEANILFEESGDPDFRDVDRVTGSLFR